MSAGASDGDRAFTLRALRWDIYEAAGAPRGVTGKNRYASAMSDEERSEARLEGAKDPAAREGEEGDEGETGSPFDHPFFLPVLLWALAIWFGYDGWINQDPDMLEHVTFNRVGFCVLVLAGSYYTVQALRERRARVSEGGPEA